MRLTRLALPALAALMLLAACGGDDSASSALPDDAGVDAAKPAADGASGSDASQSGNDAATDAPVGCGEFTGDTRFTCSKDGNSRGKCVGGSAQIEACSRGCLRNQAPADDVCMGTTPGWSCTGSFSTSKALDGDYYLTAFGCWVDSMSVVHTDPGDNCIPACLSKAQSSGLCAKTDTGPACEEKVDWYVADSGRFGCLARLRVENPMNGKKVVVVVLDAGPACASVEDKVMHAVLDASGRVDDYLFGAQEGYSDKALVHVVEVDGSTPLGPI